MSRPGIRQVEAVTRTPWGRVRQWFDQHPIVLVVVAVVVITGCLLRLRQQPAIRSAGKLWFYDLNTGELFESSSEKLPPIDAPSAKPAADGRPAGVIAHVWGCGSCEDKSKWFVAYLETLSPSIGEREPGTTPEQLFALPSKEPKWHSSSSPKADQIFQAAVARCNGAPFLECQPGSDAR